ncbi:hypothetical protein HKX48_003112 [Thoreauomyces humboldtii]|nr:hypothetical protein HKX48_003112 [Thoreauomyces humboldtii]
MHLLACVGARGLPTARASVVFTSPTVANACRTLRTLRSVVIKPPRPAHGLLRFRAFHQQQQQHHHQHRNGSRGNQRGGSSSHSSRSSFRWSGGFWRTAPGWVLLGSVPVVHAAAPLTTPSAVTDLHAPARRPAPQVTNVILVDSKGEPQGVLTLFSRVVSTTIHVFRVSFRFLQLAVLFGPVILTFPVWFLMERGAFSRNETPNLWWVQYLVWSFEISGPTFTKLGQWASSRSDLFPPYVCAILGKLQSHVSPHSQKATRKIIEKEYGMSIEDMFEIFGENPIGVGAIAQVYRAKLRPFAPTEQRPHTLECAVKVLHPGVESLINADLTIMSGVASLIHLLPGAEWLSFPDEVEMFGGMMREQLDLRFEAENLARFMENFKDRENVGFPAPFLPLMRKSVLIEEFQCAIPIRKFLDHGHTPYDHDLAQIGLDSFLRMLVIHNFVHADLHPGNIFVTFRRPKASRWNPFQKSSEVQQSDDDDVIDSAEVTRLASLPTSEWPAAIDNLKAQGYTAKMIFLDAGLVSTLSNENLRNFLDLFRAVAEFDGARVANLMMERSKTPHTVIDRDEFVVTMRAFLDEVKHHALKLKNIKVGEILAKVFNMVRTHHIKIEGDFANVGISIVLLEGIGRRLDPDIDLLQEALPILRIAATQGRGGAYEGSSGLGELGSGWTYWAGYAYLRARPLLAFTTDWVDVGEYEDARVFFSE